jgi:hypothetical protein
MTTTVPTPRLGNQEVHAGYLIVHYPAAPGYRAPLTPRELVTSVADARAQNQPG